MRISRFVLLYGGLVIFLIYLINRTRRRPKPTQFDFGPRRIDQNPNRPKERVLNCLFEFKGEQLDAFEVLGVPAGCGDDLIRDGYRKSLVGAGDDSAKARIVAAFDALKLQRGSL